MSKINTNPQYHVRREPAKGQFIFARRIVCIRVAGEIHAFAAAGESNEQNPRNILFTMTAFMPPVTSGFVRARTDVFVCSVFGSAPRECVQVSHEANRGAEELTIEAHKHVNADDVVAAGAKARRLVASLINMFIIFDVTMPGGHGRVRPGIIQENSQRSASENGIYCKTSIARPFHHSRPRQG